jgi:hypothetical protein
MIKLINEENMVLEDVLNILLYSCIKVFCNLVLYSDNIIIFAWATRFCSNTSLLETQVP